MTESKTPRKDLKRKVGSDNKKEPLIKTDNIKSKEDESKNTPKPKTKKEPLIKTVNIKSKEDESKKLADLKTKIEQSKKEVLDEILIEFAKKKKNLEKEITDLENKRDSLKKELQISFLGQSDNIAKRVKGFQDYLTGALQHLSQSVEKLELVSQPIIVKPSPLDNNNEKSSDNEKVSLPALADTFKPDEKLIRKCFQKFIEQPDFYAEPWKLRRSLDSEDIEILDDWFFNMGGRGSLESRGSRQKNVLLSAGLISVLGELYGDQFQTLILASEPERLGEWRRLLQDSLGLTREDFGPNSGIVLFERPEGVIERADRLEANDEVPLIIVDASEVSVEIPILQFPLWLAFAGSEDEIYNDYDLN